MSSALQKRLNDRYAVWDADSGGPKDHVLDGGADPQGEGQLFWGKISSPS